MINIKYLRENKKEVLKGIKAKGFNVDIDMILELDEKRSLLRQEIEHLNAERKKAALKKNIKQGKEIKNKLSDLENEEKEVEEKLNQFLRKSPNLPLPEVPIGKGETDNIVIREVGEKPEFDFPAKDYMELGEKLGWIDTERSGKAIGSRFGYLLRDAVDLEFALVRFAFDVLKK